MTGRVARLLFAVAATFCGSAAQSPAEIQRAPDLPTLAVDGLPPLVQSIIRDAGAAAKANPADAVAVGRFGMVLQAHNFLKEAEICYSRARSLDPEAFRWTYYLAYVQVAQANCADAAITANAALRIKADYLPARLIAARCLVVGGDWEKAGDIYTAIIREHPDNAEAHYGLGRVYVAANEPRKAIESFSRACDLFPAFGAAHFAAARAYLRLGDNTKADREMALSKENEALYAFPETEDPLLDEVVSLYRDFDDYMKLAGQLRVQGKNEQAAAAYEEALRINPELSEAHVWLVHLYGRMGQPDKAEEHFRSAVALAPNKPETYFVHGEAILSQGKLAEAEQAFRKALELNPTRAEARLSLAYVLDRQGRTADAITELRRTVAQKPDMAPAHFSLGRILVKEANFEAGIPSLLKAAQLSEDATRTSYLHAIGLAYAGFGDVDNAIRFMRLAQVRAAAQGDKTEADAIAEDLKLLTDVNLAK